MGLTDAMITADAAAIFSDLSATNISQTVQRIPKGTKTVERTFEVIDAKKRTAQELLNTGFSTMYRFTVYAQKADVGGTAIGDILVMASGERLRVYRPEDQPGGVWISYDLGDEFESGRDLD